MSSELEGSPGLALFLGFLRRRPWKWATPAGRDGNVGRATLAPVPLSHRLLQRGSQGFWGSLKEVRGRRESREAWTCALDLPTGRAAGAKEDSGFLSQGFLRDGRYGVNLDVVLTKPNVPSAWRPQLWATSLF